LRERRRKASSGIIIDPAGEKLVELIDQQNEIAAQLPLAPLRALLLLRDLVERAKDRLDRRGVAVREQCGKLGGLR
jgi:hypothetical protein